MDIYYDSGINLEDKEEDKKVILDPTKQSEIGVVTHGHLDHLTKDAFMTPPTLDILDVRLGEKRGEPIFYGFPQDIGGFDVTLYPAGHVFGSSMVMVEDVLYTGDFNPYGGKTCKKAVPYDPETLIVETTYGKDDYHLPPKDDVMGDMMGWAKQQLDEGPVVFGAYSFGKAQETIALLNELGKTPHVTQEIADISEVYNQYDLGLEYRMDTDFDDNFTAVVPPKELKDPIGEIQKESKKKNGNSAYLSGWCAFFPFFNTMDIDAQFPLSDHAGFKELLDYVEASDPEKVYTVHGSAQEFADIVKERLDIEAEVLHS